MTYHAPVRSLSFALHAQAGFDGLLATGAFDGCDPDTIAAILSEAARLSENVLAPLNWSGDRFGVRWSETGVETAPGFKAAYQAFQAGGWQGLSADPHYGGQGLPRAIGLAVHEMIEAANMAFALCPMLTHGSIEALHAHGADALRQTFLPKMVAGAWTGAMNITEPQAGSDAGAGRTSATPTGDGRYLVRGQKIFITWGDHDLTENVVHLVLARLPGAVEGSKGLSLFLCPKFLHEADGRIGARNDLRAIGVEHKLGIHASPTCTMAFGEKDGAIGYLIGQEGFGLAAMFTMMNSARLHVGAQGVAIAERALQQARSFATERKQGRAELGHGEIVNPAPIILHPDVRRMIASMAAKIAAGRALCLATAVAADLAIASDSAEARVASRRREDLLTPLAKAWCSDMGVEVASIGIQVHGGMGFVEETGAAQHLRDARIAPIYEGTNGIQAIDLVGRKLLADRGVAFKELMETCRRTAAQSSAYRDERVQSCAGLLSASVQAAQDAGAWILQSGANDRRDALAGASAFLTLVAETAAAGLLLEGAQAAVRAKMQDGADQVFLDAQIGLAKIFCDQHLPMAQGWAARVKSGAASLFAPDLAALSA